MRETELTDIYRRDGYICLRGLLSAGEVATLNGECAAVAGGQDILALHFPHKLSATYLKAMHHNRIVEILTTLIGPDIKAVQSMLFIKPSGKPGQAWHQDEHFIPTRDRSLCAAWIALDDTDIENGCLWVHAGSHRDGIIYPVNGHDDTRFDASPEAGAFTFEREGGTAVEMRAGDTLFFNGYLLHRSLPNLSESRTRRSLVVHYMNARSLLPWNYDGENPCDDHRDIEMVAGVDPYAWKGIADITRLFVRSEEAA
jgi:phytanoyl-CoA hydroxylase